MAPRAASYATLRGTTEGTIVRTRIDKRATNVSVLAAIGVRRDGQKVLLAIRNMAGFCSAVDTAKVEMGGEPTSAAPRRGSYKTLRADIRMVSTLGLSPRLREVALSLG